MSLILDGSAGITTPMYNGTISANTVTPSVNMKNRLINGNMVIDQRNAGASVTPADNQYTLDRWKSKLTQASKYSVQQNAGSVTPPAGFKNYLGVTSLSAYSITSTDRFGLQYPIEGFNVADLDFGNANAKTVTLSFWVRSSLTGTFGGAFFNDSANRSYPFTYTISSANTWEQKSVTFAGDTTGTWLSNNLVGLYVEFGLGTGSTYSGTAGTWAGAFYASATGATSIVGTNGATFYITGVQLEVGSSATSFDYRPYGTELALCQRYYFRNSWGVSEIIGTAQAYNTTGGAFGQLFNFPVSMRATPTLSNSGGNSFQLTSTGSGRVATTSIALNATPSAVTLGDSASGATTIAGGASVLYSKSSGVTYIDASAEL